MAKPHIFIVAAEKSGDELGAGLARALREQSDKKVHLSAIGGSALRSVGLHSPIDIAPLSILGFLEGLKSYPTIMQLVRQAVDLIQNADPDAVVLIDSWGFMARVAQRLKKQGFRGNIIKYVAPQVWAMREGRAKILANIVDHLLTIHSFDAPYFTKYGLETTYVGNPVFDQKYDTGDGRSLREDYNIPSNAPVLTLLFGSRLSEIQTLAAPFGDAVERLQSFLPELRIVAPVSDTVSADVYAAVAKDPHLQNIILLSEARKLDSFAASDVAMACSGTVSTQLACAGVPTVVAYRLNTLTYIIAKRLFKPDYVSIVNIAADEDLMPEFIQHECTGENLANAVLAYFKDPKRRDTAKQSLLSATANMQRGNAENARNGKDGNSSTRAAIAILGLLETA